MLRNEARLLLVTAAVLSESPKDASATVTRRPEVHVETRWIANGDFFVLFFFRVVYRLCGETL